MPTATTVVTVHQVDGWHARPATEFARIVGEFGLAVTIGRAGEEAVRGDSVLSLMTLGARQNEQLTIVVNFEATDEANAQQLIEALHELF
ncbi:MAG: HPr family phosphocarrier protein [Micrococcales bacterium]